MTTVSVTEASRDFVGTLRRMEAGHEAVIVKRGQKAVAVMVPPDMLEALEDLEDIREADKALAAHRKDPSGAVTLAEYEHRRKGREVYR
jgi:antitoxin (DNA-binding transcriptional repressor) of toxin-antitoxin stability system